jgi:isopentenyl-diphosphate Delta-isomerase
MKKTDLVILVDTSGNYVGLMEKMEAHKQGILHKAFSVVIFNSKGEMLIQKRAAAKYHFRGLWSNACCSHQRPEETTEQSVSRRLNEELNLENIKTEYLFTFIYKARDIETNLIEHEYDEVYIAVYDGDVKPNPAEIEEVRWISMTDLRGEIELEPDKFSYWFKEIVKELNTISLNNPAANN